MQTFSKAVIGAVALLALTVLVYAQGTFSLATGTGGTDNVGVNSTNTYYVDVSEHETVSLFTKFKGTGASTSSLQWIGYRSLGFSALGSPVYETAPFWQEYQTMSGTTTVDFFTHLDVQGGAVIRLQLINTNATVAATNLGIVVRFKAPKEAVFSTSR